MKQDKYVEPRIIKPQSGIVKRVGILMSEKKVEYNIKVWIGFAVSFLIFSISLSIIHLFYKLYNKNFLNLDIYSFGSFYGGMLGPAFSFLGIVGVLQQFKFQVDESNRNFEELKKTNLRLEKKQDIEFKLSRLDLIFSRITQFEDNLTLEGWTNQRGSITHIIASRRNVFSKISTFETKILDLARVANIGNPSQNLKFLPFNTSQHSAYINSVSYDFNCFYDFYSFFSLLNSFRDYMAECYYANEFADKEYFERDFDAFLTRCLPNVVNVKNFCGTVMEYNLNNGTYEELNHFRNLYNLSGRLLEVFEQDLNTINPDNT